MSKELERQAFMEHLKANPTDLDTRRIFADWLMDNDEPEFSNFQRNFSTEAYFASQDYLEMFADECQISLNELIDGATRFRTNREWLCIGTDTPEICFNGMIQFWKSYQFYTNTLIPNELSSEFIEDAERCAC